MLRFEIIELVILLFVVIVGSRFIWRCCMLPRAWRGTKGPACGACGYAWTGQTRCPECGREISHVGLATPWLVLRLGPDLLAGGLSLLVLLSVGWRAGLEVGVELERAFAGTPNPAKPPKLVRSVRATNAALTNLASAPSKVPLAAAVYEDFTRDQSTFPPPWKTIEGTVIIAVFDPASPPNNPSATVDGFQSDVPHIRIDTVAPKFQAFDAAGKLLAEGPLPTKADAAKLIASAGIDLGNSINAEAADRMADFIVLAASKVDSGGWGPDWISAAFQARLVFGNPAPGLSPTIQLAITGGPSTQPPVKAATAAALPPRPLWPTVWRAVWSSLCLLGGAYFFWVIAARRRRLMRPAIAHEHPAK